VDSPGLFSAAAEGFLLGASLIVAIGAQNAFVLRQGLRRRHVFAVATVCALSDAALIAAGIAGLGALVKQSPALLAGVTIAGAGFLSVYGLLSLRRAFRAEVLSPAADESAGLAATVTASLALTFLNPHVYLDTVVLIGGLSARHAQSPPSRSAWAQPCPRRRGSTASPMARVWRRRSLPGAQLGACSTCLLPW